MFTGELTEGQIEPANRLCQWKRVLLAYPMGSGKSVISIAAAEKLIELGYIESVLILCLPSIGWQWRDRLDEFTDHKDYRLIKREGTKKRAYKEKEALYTILPYSLFRKDYKLLPYYDLIIADEAQEFSNFRSKTFKRIQRFRPSYRWAVTGTALSNKLEELYAILEWVDKKYLPPWPQFEKFHIVRNPRTKQIIKYKNIESLNKFLLAKRMVRKSIEELQGQLPKLLLKTEYIEKDTNVDGIQQDLYQTLSRDTNKFNKISPEVSKAFHKARESLARSKIEWASKRISTVLSESEHNRVVIYCFYKLPLHDLHEHLSKLGISSALFTGDESADEKSERIKALRDGKVQVLLSSNAGATGLDIPYANYTIHLDVPFSHGIMDQRSHRTQRTSSLFKTVVVIYSLVKDSIDEYYFNAVIRKATLAKATQDGGIDEVVMRDTSLLKFLEQFYGY